jgi:hypothetical protein
LFSGRQEGRERRKEGRKEGKRRTEKDRKRSEENLKKAFPPTYKQGLCTEISSLNTE